MPLADVLKPIPPRKPSGKLPEAEPSKTFNDDRAPETLMSDVLVQAHEAITHYLADNNVDAPHTRGLTKQLDKSPKTTQVRELILVGLALRMSKEEIEKQVRKEVPDAVLEDAQGSLVTYYRRKYRELIDELYAVVATQIGDVYRYTDKLYRLSRYNTLTEVVDKQLGPRLEAGICDDITFKLGNLYVKLMEKLNYEMGNQNIGKLIRFSPNNSKRPVGKAADEYFKEKFGGQLPAGFLDKLQQVDAEVGGNGTNS